MSSTCLINRLSSCVFWNMPTLDMFQKTQADCSTQQHLLCWTVSANICWIFKFKCHLPLISIKTGKWIVCSGAEPIFGGTLGSQSAEPHSTTGIINSGARPFVTALGPATAPPPPLPNRSHQRIAPQTSSMQVNVDLIKYFFLSSKGIVSLVLKSWLF